MVDGILQSVPQEELKVEFESLGFEAAAQSVLDEVCAFILDIQRGDRCSPSPIYTRNIEPFDAVLTIIYAFWFWFWFWFRFFWGG